MTSLENRINGRGDPSCLPRNTLYPQKLALTSPTSGGRSVGIFCLRTKSNGACIRSSRLWSTKQQSESVVYGKVCAVSLHRFFMLHCYILNTEQQFCENMNSEIHHILLSCGIFTFLVSLFTPPLSVKRICQHFTNWAVLDIQPAGHHVSHITDWENSLSEIWGSHGSDIEDYCLLGCDAMYSCRKSTRLHDITSQKIVIFDLLCYHHF
jgi:hypothetical protein